MNAIVKYMAAVCVAVLGSVSYTFGQEQSKLKVPISIFFPEGHENIVPANAQVQLGNKLTSAAAKAGVGSTTDFTQFYLTYGISVLDSQVIPGAPTQYSQELEISLYVVDALAKKIFNTTVLTQRGTGRSLEVAYSAAIKQLPITSKDLQNFFITTSDKIVEYYNSQYKIILQQTQALVAAQKYEEALFTLSVVPEACSGYAEVVSAATKIYQQYVDDKAYKNLAKARAIWSAGLDAASAAEAGLLLAEIPENAKCYPQALELQNEIKARIKDDVEYERELLKLREEREYKLADAEITTWKAVGVAYGNNQKSDTYYNAWPFIK